MDQFQEIFFEKSLGHKIDPDKNWGLKACKTKVSSDLRQPLTPSPQLWDE